MRKVEVKKGTNIQYSSRELLFLAPSGQPYRGTIYINFISKGESINLLDLKKYITTLRDTISTSENIAFIIFDKINSAIKTKKLGVVVDITARGGIQQRVSFGKAFEPIVKNNIFQV
ncbi:MAG: hypothetical protein QM493_06995 [Sulfurovum sp.]